MKRDFYTTPQSTPIMRLLWKASGGDKYILERATYSDQIKYMCLGGIIIATGIMAALAGGYALFTIFSPRGSALESESYFYHVKDTISTVKDTLHVFQNSTINNDSPTSFEKANELIINWKLIWTTIISIIFGCFWGLMIFNLDRFIISSTGKGDGTEAITWTEIKGAIPRIIMGAIIALTISKPVEIRMFKTEIDAALHEEQLVKQKDYEIRTRKTFEDRIKDLETENTSIQKRIDDYLNKITVKDSLYNVETASGQGGRTKGEGPVAIALKTERDRLKDELDQYNRSNKSKIDDIDNRRKVLNDDLEIALSKDKKVSDGLDGLLERIKLAHKVSAPEGGVPWISIFITLLFLAIELTPIFFKLMLVKSPYDYLKDNVEELMKAEQGIHIEYNYYKDKEGQERDLITFLHKDKIIAEKKSAQKIQDELTEYAYSKYVEKMKKKIDENPDEFINSSPSNES